MKKTLKRLAVGAFLCSVAAPVPAHAEEMAESLMFLKNVAVNSRKLASPSIFGIGSARTMGAYNGFFAGAVSNDSRTSQDESLTLDASAAAGIGIGDPYKTLGFDAYLGIISVNPKGEDGGFGVGEDGNMSFKVGHTFLTDEFDSISIAMGVNNQIAWGNAERINKNVYGVVSVGSAVEIGGNIVPVSVSLGAGSKQKDNLDLGYFGGLGVKLSDVVDLSAGYNATRWVTGLNFSLSRSSVPVLQKLVFQIGIDDVLNNDNNRRGVFIVALPFSL